jgi:hypothetical protein
MGHAYVKNLSDILLKRIYAKGRVSIEELVDYCVNNKVPLNASEGDYYEGYMIELGLSHLILFHAKKWCKNKHRPNLEPIAENERQEELIKRFHKSGLSDLGDSDNIEDWNEFRKIKWKFTQGTRKMYLDKTIPIIVNIEN